MAHYQARGQLYFNDTRDEAAEAAVQRWAELSKTHDIREVALIADASNAEIDRLNARAQHLRIDRGELWGAEAQLPHQYYGLYEGDLVTFTAQHRSPGQARVENGTRGQVTRTHDDGLTVLLDGSQREVTLAGQDLETLRLAYAQHVYRQQGATVERAVVVTGGWQTSKETAYVQASRARNGTEWYLARDELGIEGQDERRVKQLAEKMRASHRHTPSLAHPELPDSDWGTGFKPTLAPSRSRLPGLARTIHRITQPDQSPDRGR
jgi:ATP-dependent exoDNAse (exonuclease V) alpha subunit